ncbi:potassium voltage-gated channel subfamily D member 2-like [Paramacrobiotus metropolitanus]|uniref:potassium voltage-gated channel subfamily D member 2-like n=1 Tax=Paramacrobiotus metropolitanus TaxID=2943436 RepID=UPI00244614BA|nr:potassium voltage-gated channel subfamily D member 2-like [Paramacrobiotus metropolitanus]
MLRACLWRIPQHIPGSTSEDKLFRQCLLTIVIVTLSASVMMYHCERAHAETPITSGMTAFWYNAIIMATVGYGGLVPKSVTGKIITSTCTLNGALLMMVFLQMLYLNACRASDHYYRLREKQKTRQAWSDPAERSG